MYKKTIETYDNGHNPIWQAVNVYLSTKEWKQCVGLTIDKMLMILVAF